MKVRQFAAIVAGVASPFAAVALSIAANQPPASAATARPAANVKFCASQAGHWHGFGPDYAWAYVSKAEARYFRISPCSIVLSGSRSSFITRPNGQIVPGSES